MHTAGTARRADERGMTTAEYAIGTVAAASFAALLIKLLTSEQVQRLLMRVVTSALDLAA
ncbi:DUF4244 domain-containing protein [Actinopolymorpha sp. B17G11]|uniref:DUF4244 domain-containing protein n=1 Tax=unclassified Actinopolymorpha TaxID=2627063 RepID=UPI0032D9788E